MLTSAGLWCRQAGTPHPGAVPTRKLGAPEGGRPPSHVGTTIRKEGQGTNNVATTEGAVETSPHVSWWLVVGYDTRCCDVQRNQTE